MGAVPLSLSTSQPSAQPDQTPRNEKQDYTCPQDSEAVACHSTVALTGDVGVEEFVHVDPLGGKGDVGDPEIEREHGDEKR